MGMAQKHSTHFGSVAQTPHDEYTSGRACLRRRHTTAPKWERPKWEWPKWEWPKWEWPKWEWPKWERPKWERPKWEWPKRERHYTTAARRHCAVRAESVGTHGYYGVHTWYSR